MDGSSGTGHDCRPQPQPQRGTDRISSLPDRLLLRILVRLPCARAAVRTIILSRRWRGLSARLPEADVTLRDVPLGSLEDALRRAARPELLRLLDIRVPVEDSPPAASVVSSVLRAAARLSSARLRFTLLQGVRDVRDSSVVVELPRFHRATAIELHGLDLRLAHSQASTGFPLLERLSLTGCHLGDLILVRCPRLRALTVASSTAAPGAASVNVHSFTLQELAVVRECSSSTRRIDVKAPELKRLTAYAGVAQRLGLWNLLEVSLETADRYRRWALTDAGEDDACPQLPLDSFSFPNEEITFAAEISKHMVTHFSGLELHLETMGHEFEAFVLRLLWMDRIRRATRSLKIILLRSEVKATCPINCPCDEPKNWRTHNVSLANLENLEIEGFEGNDGEFDFLKVVFRRSSMLKRVIVKVPDEVITNDDWCTKLHNIFMAYPFVEGNIDLIPSN